MALFAPHFTLSSNGLSVCILANGLSTNVTKAGFSRFCLSKTYQTSVRKRWSSISCPIIWLACSINCRICVCPGGRLLSIHQILVLCDIYRLHRCWIIDSYANVGHIKQVHAKANLPGPGCWMGILLWCTPKVSKKYWIDTKKIGVSANYPCILYKQIYFTFQRLLSLTCDPAFCAAVLLPYSHKSRLVRGNIVWKLFVARSIDLLRVHKLSGIQLTRNTTKYKSLFVSASSYRRIHHWDTNSELEFVKKFNELLSL